MTTLQLRNPHSVLAALERRPQDVLSIRVTQQSASGSWRDVLVRAQSLNVAIQTRRTFGVQQPGHKERRTGAGEADVRSRPDVPLDEMFTQTGDEDGLWLALDHIQDPHNVGAIFRTAAFFGVRGIIVTKDRSAPLSATVYDVASGGLEAVPFSEQTNLTRAIEKAKEAGLWVLGTSERAPYDVRDVKLDRNWLLVLGNEEKGMSQLVSKRCDEVCRLSPRGPVASLNVSVAAGILIAALSR